MLVNMQKAQQAHEKIRSYTGNNRPLRKIMMEDEVVHGLAGCLLKTHWSVPDLLWQVGSIDSDMGRPDLVKEAMTMALLHMWGKVHCGISCQDCAWFSIHPPWNVSAERMPSP